MKKCRLAVVAAAFAVFPAPPLFAQAISSPRGPAPVPPTCPPQVNPVRNTTIKVYITTQLAAPASNMTAAMIWSSATQETLLDELNRAASADGNRFVNASSSKDSNVDIDITVDNSSSDFTHKLTMKSWNSLQVDFTALGRDDARIALKALVEKIYPYFHLGYQAGPDACRPWIK